MAISTAQVTRARELHDVMEKYIETRRRAFSPYVQRIAADTGLSERAVLFFGYVRPLVNADLVTEADLKRRVCYQAKRPWVQRWQELVGTGHAEPATDGWRITPKGHALIDRFWAANREHQCSLPLPAEPLRRVVSVIEAILKDVPSQPGERVHMIRRTAPDDRPKQPDAVRVEFAMFELAVTLDDGHISAWRTAGYDGPSVDVLTRVWYGKERWDDLVQALSFTQEPADVERNVRELIERGDLAREGDRVTLTAQGRGTRERIEQETDRLGLARWPSGAALESLIADVSALVAGLPPEDQLPSGPTH